MTPSRSVTFYIARRKFLATVGGRRRHGRSRRAFDLQTGCTNWLNGTHRSRPRWPAPLVEPGAVFAHLLALRCRRVALAGRSLVALGRRAPTQLDAVVGVVRHLEIDRTVDHVAQRERPRGAITARIRELARRQLGREHALQFGLHLRDALVLRHRVAFGSPRDSIRKAEYHVDRAAARTLRDAEGQERRGGEGRI